MTVTVKIVRGTVIEPGREAAAGDVLQVEPLTAHALLCAGAAELVDAADVATVNRAVQADNARPPAMAELSFDPARAEESSGIGGAVPVSSPAPMLGHGLDRFGAQCVPAAEGAPSRRAVLAKLFLA
jgi:hypothetical protein